MTDQVVVHDAASQVEQAEALTHALENMLEQEFEHLKAQNLDSFEALQADKVALLNQLASLTGLDQSATSADTLGPEWDNFKERMNACKSLHRRNEVLIGRKIDAIRGALQSLQLQDPASSVEIYDRLGKLSRVRRGRGYSDA